MTHEQRGSSRPIERRTQSLLLSSPLSSPPPSPALLTSAEKRSSRVSPATLNNHLNNLCTMADPQQQQQTASQQQQQPPPEDYSLFLSENGHLSFENPNYQLGGGGGSVGGGGSSSVDPARLDDHLNSNIPLPVSVFEELRDELEVGAALSSAGVVVGGGGSCSNGGGGSGSSGSRSPRSSSKRKAYASMDITAMGVDVNEGPKTTLDNKIAEEKMRESVEKLDRYIADSTAQIKASTVDCDKGEIESDKLVESTKEKDDKSDGEQDTKEQEQKEVVRRRKKKRPPTSGGLPQGWEKHEDEAGPYYWHVKSGTIQRDPPRASEFDTEEDRSAVVRDVRSSRIFDDDFDATSPLLSTPGQTAMPKSTTSGSISELTKDKGKEKTSSNKDKSEKDLKRRSMPPSNEDSSKAMQVQVRSLGWVELREDELTPENSSKAVNRCIVKLSPGSTSDVATAEAAGQWGEGKDLILELNEGSLKLIMPDTAIVLNSQPIHSIRVWGVGRDNGRDFAYVARDKHTRKHMCHVFRCDVPARAIANALRDICKKILIERSLAQSSSKLTGATSGQRTSVSDSPTQKDPPSRQSKSTSGQAKKDRMRPTSLGGNFNTKLQTKTVPAPESFPTPMEEPRKVIKAWFLGTQQVDKPCGIDVIHGAIDHLMDTTVRADWKLASVAVAPSTVTVSFADGKSTALDCRVRFLSFLGIGESSQQCAFIMHTAQDTFVAHVFHCEPSAGPLCKTIEAACKLRYQKCLDARPQRLIVAEANAVNDGTAGTNTRHSIGATIKNMFGSWTGKGKFQHQIQSPPPS